MATTEAPKLTFARTASSADVTHIDDSDGSMRKRIVEMDPKAAKESNNFFLCGAIRVKPECNSSAGKYIRTMVSDTTHRDDCQGLQSHRYGIDIKAGNRLWSEFQ